jgi:S-adenosylmethionine:tRNA ribosyltransferase-isomerase
VEVGNKLSAGDYRFDVIGQDAHVFLLRPLFEVSEFAKFFEKFGTTPVPKYIGETEIEERELREKYQSIFAENPASIAAPTASLHFTEGVIESLENKNIKKTFITLHVGRGTFAPVTEDNFETGKLHSEFYEVPKSSRDEMNRAKEQEQKIIAVGTTVARALEAGGEAGETDMFIRKPYEFKRVDGLITNFHLPGTSLMCLVDAFLDFKNSKRNISDLYKVAIDEKFRFYSFGDAMLII